MAQRIVYCLREMKAVKQVGKEGNTLIYRTARHKRPRDTDAAA